MLLGIAEILTKYAELRTKVEKIEWLKKNNSFALRTVLQGAFDPNIVWDLPDGDPPYKPTPYLDQESMLYNESKKFYLYIKGGHPTLTQDRKLKLFIQLLESVTPADAIMLLHMKDKKLPYPGLTIKTINEAFPGLIPIIESSKEVKRTSDLVEKVTEVE